MERQASTNFRYRAFVSYSHQDERWAKWLHKALESYRVPARLVGTHTDAGIIPPRLAPVFRDRDELPSAPDLNRQVVEAIEQSANLIVVCSPNSAASRWVNEEVRAFKRLDRGDRIFCLIVAGEPNASDLAEPQDQECFCPALRFALGADGQLSGNRAEPIAADVRSQGDGRTNAKLKLIAGMLGVGLDALRQREQQRRVRRLTAIAGVSLAALVVTTGLAITAMIARDAAQRRQTQAEELVDFMLGDLSDKLDKVHRLDIMQAVIDQAMLYFQSLPTADVTDEALAQRVVALEKIGSVRIDQGQLPAALDAYKAASTLAAELLHRSPDLAHQAAYGDSLKWKGQVYWYVGDLEHALRDFDAATDTLRRVSAARPQDMEISFKLAAALNDAAHVLQARGELDAAKAKYVETKEIYEDLSKRDPASARWQSFLGDAFDNLGKVALERGKLDEAITAYRTQQRIQAALASLAPNDHMAQEHVVIANAILARTLALCGEDQKALGYASDAVRGAKSLVEFDSSATYWLEDFAYYSQLMGRLLRHLGRYDEAAAANVDAIRGLAKLVATDDTNVRWQRELVQSRLEKARLDLARGNTDGADAQARSTMGPIAKFRAKQPDNRDWVLVAAETDLLLGTISDKRGDTATALDRWTRARDTVSAAAQVGADPNFLAALASAHLLLGDMHAARPLVKRLWSMGYRTPDFVTLARSKGLPYIVNEEFAQRVAAGEAGTDCAGCTAHGRLSAASK